MSRDYIDPFNDKANFKTMKGPFAISVASVLELLSQESRSLRGELVSVNQSVSVVGTTLRVR